MSIRETARAVSHLLLHQLFPPHCPACGVPVAAGGNLCPECFGALHHITAPLCACCGIPFALPTPEGTLCPECISTPPSFDHARAVVVYNDIAGTLVGNLKYHDRMAMLHRLAAQMQQAGGGLLANTDVLVPVPLHWRRLLKRRYNQSAWLAYQLSALSGLPCAPDALARIRHTKPQTGMPRSQRQKNLRAAFAVHAPEAVAGKRVLLVDDVLTTGATANACANALKKAGALQVNVLAFARTVKA